MSLVKGSINTGGNSLQSYLKDGNNLHTEFVEEWILIEDQNIAASTGCLWRLSERDLNVRLVSLWANTTGSILVNVQSRGTAFFSIAITNAQATNGYLFPTFIVPSKFDLTITPSAATSKLFLTAKEIAITENSFLARP